MSLQKFFEQHLQLHTLRIELNSGRVLRYRVDAQRKEELEGWMRDTTNSFGSVINPFLSFYADYDRIVFVRISTVKRFIFCWDYATTVDNPNSYSDPFGILENQSMDANNENDTGIDDIEGRTAPNSLLDLDLDEGFEESNAENKGNSEFLEEDELANTGLPDIPDAIILTQEGIEPLLYYGLDEEVDCLMTSMETSINDITVEGRFISLTDEDGENNYIPVQNILCLDVARRLIFNDNEWSQMEKIRMLGDNTN